MSRVHCGEILDGSQCLSLTRRFNAFADSLEESFGCSLVRPRFECAGDIKKFCTGLIEGQIDHPWRLCLRGLSSSSRMSIAHSLFLFRKLVPSEKPQVGPYVERMCSASDPADPRFLRFAVNMVQRLFPLGWDRSYRDKCCTSTLPISSCSESGRKLGGCRGLDASVRWDREDFCSYVLESVAPRRRGVSRVQAILTEGKWRIISIPPRVDNALRPLHSSLYDHISRFTWCLRGDAKPSSFRDFSSKQGEVFVSGDYESATDNLNKEVQLTILAAVLDRARTVPPGIRAHALEIFSSELVAEGGVSGVQQRGQLMGELCSFPLLCLVNYITFKYLVRRDVPVRINGDDIVFRSTPQEAERWCRGVQLGGLTLSKGKTLVHSRFLSLNSTMFRSSGRGVRFVPFVRPKAVWSDKEHECERISSLKSRFYSFAVGFGRRRRRPFERLFLRENMTTVQRCRRSLTRGMGMKLDRQSLESSGLWHRELFYLEHVSEPPLPAFSFARYRCNDFPTGWSRVSPRWYTVNQVNAWRTRLAFETVKRAWANPVVVSDSAKERWMADCDAGCSPWGLASWVNPRMRKLLRLSRKQLWRYVCLRRNASVFGRTRFERGEGVLKPDAVESIVPPVVSTSVVEEVAVGGSSVSVRVDGDWLAYGDCKVVVSSFRPLSIHFPPPLEN